LTSLSWSILYRISFFKLQSLAMLVGFVYSCLDDKNRSRKRLTRSGGKEGFWEERGKVFPVWQGQKLVGWRKEISPLLLFLLFSTFHLRAAARQAKQRGRECGSTSATDGLSAATIEDGEGGVSCSNGNHRIVTEFVPPPAFPPPFMGRLQI
jgi:hypothetical protein